MLSLLASHTRYRNSHNYLIDLLTIHMIQYSSGYDARFPRKRSWFESQLGNNIYFFVVVVFCLHLSYFDIFSLFSSSEPLGSQGELIVYSWSGVRPSVRRRSQCSNIFFSETAWPIKAKFYAGPPWEGGTKFI